MHIQPCENFGHIRADGRQLPVLGRQNPVGRHPVEKRQQMIPETIQIEEQDRLAMKTQLPLDENLADFLERTQSPGQRDINVASIGKTGLAGSHIGHRLQRMQLTMGNRRELIQNDPFDTPPRLKCASGKSTHYADAGAPVNQHMPSFGQPSTDRTTRREEALGGMARGSGIHRHIS